MLNETIKTKDGSIEYSSYGSGLHILFIHGGHVNSHFTLPHKGFDLNKFQLITPSRPGYGNTPLNDDNKTPAQTTKLIISLLDHLKINKVIVYGISAGGWTALELAAQFPERINKLILGSAVVKDWLDKKGKTYLGAKIIFNPGIEWIIWGLVKLFGTLSPYLIAKIFLPEFSTVKYVILPKNEAKELMRHLKTFRSKKGFINDIDQKIDTEILKKIKCPVLIIHSKNDNSVSIEHAEFAHNQIINSKIIILDNLWGHMIWIGKDYELIQKDIFNFINE